LLIGLAGHEISQFDTASSFFDQERRSQQPSFRGIEKWTRKDLAERYHRSEVVILPYFQKGKTS
jgi:hypothetical protein